MSRAGNAGPGSAPSTSHAPSTTPPTRSPGFPTKARSHQQYSADAVAAYADPNDPAWAFGDQAGSHTNLAIARITSGDLDGAVEAIRPVLDLPAAQRINGIRHSVQRVQRALVYAGLTDSAADLIEEMDTFAATSAIALPW